MSGDSSVTDGDSTLPGVEWGVRRMLRNGCEGLCFRSTFPSLVCIQYPVRFLEFAVYS